MQMVYVRINRFDKIEEECKTDLDRLLFSLKNAENLDEMPRSFSGNEFKQIFEIAKITNFNKEEFMNYERQMKYYSDYVNSLEYAKEKGIAIGMEKTARAMLAKGYSVSDIMGITNLSRKEVMALR